MAQNRLKTTHRHVHYNNRQAVANSQANRQTTDPNRCLTKNGNDNTRRSVAANATRVVATMIQIECKPDKPAPMQFCKRIFLKANKKRRFNGDCGKRALN